MDSWTGRENTTGPGTFFRNSDKENVSTEIAQLYLVTYEYEFSISPVLYTVKLRKIKLTTENSGTHLRISR